MPGRSLSLSNYRFGFNGKENDDETKSKGNWQDYGMRVYDPRLGRFPNPDPLTIKYPDLTPYQFASNSPIKFIDIDGAEAGEPGNNSFKSALSISNPISLKMENEAMKNAGAPAAEIVGEILQSTGDAAMRVSSSLAYGIIAGYYAATEKKINSLVFGFDWQKGFFNISDPESSINTKKLLKSVVSLEVSHLTTIDIKNPIADLCINNAKDVLIDRALDKAVPTPHEVPEVNSSSSNSPQMPGNNSISKSMKSGSYKQFEILDRPKVPSMPQK